MAKKKKKVTKPPREMTKRALSHHKRQVRRQRFIFIGGVAIIAAVVIIVLLGWFLGMYRPLNTTVITVGDREFKTGYVVDYAGTLWAMQPTGELAQMIGNYVNDLVQNEVARQAAAELGYTVSDDEVSSRLEELGLPENEANMDIIRISLLYNLLKSEFFSSEVPASQSQVHMKAMLVESRPVGIEAWNRLLRGEDFANLIDEFAADYTARELNQGDYGWHPRSIMESAENLGSAVPVDYAFGAEAGDVSLPLRDAGVNKQLGYWLIKIDQKFTEDEFQVMALYLGDQQEAEEIRQRLENGEDLAALAGEYSQYAQSRDNGGDMGLIVRPTEDQPIRVSEVFDNYLFGEEREAGIWSLPVRDETLWTKGGYWVVQVVDRDDDRELSEEDYDELLSRAYSQWMNGIMAEYNPVIDRTGLTPEVQELILKELS